MKRRSFTSVTVFVALIAAFVIKGDTASADPIILKTSRVYGEWTLTAETPESIQKLNAVGDLNHYSPFTGTYDSNGNLTSFNTFCLQKDMISAVNSDYAYSIGDEVSGSGHSDPSGPAITEGTAWLYEQFATGALDGYDFANADGDRRGDGDDLQDAIWSLEGYIDDTADYLEDLLAAEFGSYNNAKEAYTGDTVRILNQEGSQDMLILVGDGSTPVPEPTTIALWCMMLIFVVGFTARQNQIKTCRVKK